MIRNWQKTRMETKTISGKKLATFQTFSLVCDKENEQRRVPDCDRFRCHFANNCISAERPDSKGAVSDGATTGATGTDGLM